MNPLFHPKQILINHLKNSSLAPFYLLELGHNEALATPVAKQSIALNLAQELLLSWGEFFSIKGNVTVHPDIYFHPDEKGPYQVDAFAELLYQLELAPFQLPYKLAFFLHSEKMTHVLWNKLLKTLETPPPQTCFIFFNALGITLPETIQSRALKLKYPPSAKLPSISYGPEQQKAFEWAQKIIAGESPSALFHSASEFSEWDFLVEQLERSIHQRLTQNEQQKMAPLFSAWRDLQKQLQTAHEIRLQAKTRALLVTEFWMQHLSLRLT